MSQFAIIETGGKQYLVSAGDRILIEKLSDTHKEGDSVVFDKVLLTGKDGKTEVGAPYLKGASVKGVVEQLGRAAKVIVIKYKAKSRYFKKRGHRQPFTKVRIEAI